MPEGYAEILNPLNGEARVYGAKGREWGLIFDLDACTKLEEQNGGVGIPALILRMTINPSVSDLRRLITVGAAAYLRRNYGAQDKVTPTTALDVIAEGGGLTHLTKVLVVSLSKAEGLNLNPDRDERQEDDEETGGGADPPDHDATS